MQPPVAIENHRYTLEQGDRTLTFVQLEITAFGAPPQRAEVAIIHFGEYDKVSIPGFAASAGPTGTKYWLADAYFVYRDGRWVYDGFRVKGSMRCPKTKIELCRWAKHVRPDHRAETDWEGIEYERRSSGFF